MIRRMLLGTVAAGLLAAPLAAGCAPAPAGRDAAARGVSLPELSALARDAYAYTLPLYVMYRTRYDALARSGAPNRFQHARTLATPASRAVTAPNNDTVYSSAWLDLSEGPLTLHVPDTAGRYYDLAFMDFYTNNVAHVGRRATGTKAGDFAIVGPDWHGGTPAGLPVIAAPTDAVWLLGRFLVSGREDLPAVHALQDQRALTSLAGGRRGPPVNRHGITPPPRPDDLWS